VLYSNQLEWIAADDPVIAFDFNGNGRIDFADIALKSDPYFLSAMQYPIA
jgi:hypothetical protein